MSSKALLDPATSVSVYRYNSPGQARTTCAQILQCHAYACYSLRARVRCARALRACAACVCCMRALRCPALRCVRKRVRVGACARMRACGAACAQGLCAREARVCRRLCIEMRVATSVCGLVRASTRRHGRVHGRVHNLETCVEWTRAWARARMESMYAGSGCLNARVRRVDACIEWTGAWSGCMRGRVCSAMSLARKHAIWRIQEDLAVAETKDEEGHRKVSLANSAHAAPPPPTASLTVGPGIPAWSACPGVTRDASD